MDAAAHTAPPKPKLSVLAMIAVYVGLMILLTLTILSAHFVVGGVGLAIALVIAAAKALLVILFFMHIRFEARTTWIFAGAGFLWLTILITLTANDYVSRPWLNRADEVNRAEPLLLPPPPGMQRQAPESPQPIPFEAR